MKINLISDTVTTPTKGMLAAMMSAKVGDDVFKEDATVNALEEKNCSTIWYGGCLIFPLGDYGQPNGH